MCVQNLNNFYLKLITWTQDIQVFNQSSHYARLCHCYPDIRIMLNASTCRLIVRINCQIANYSLPSATKLRRLCFYTCLSVHGGVCLSTCWDSTPLPPEKAPTLEAGSPQEQTPPRACTPSREQAPPKSRHHPPRAAPPPVDGYCCGQYASYWNAFLLACHFVSA